MRLENQRDRDHRIGEARPQHRHQDERQQSDGEGQDDVHDPHDDRVDPPAEIAGDDATRIPPSGTEPVTMTPTKSENRVP